MTMTMTHTCEHWGVGSRPPQHMQERREGQEPHGESPRPRARAPVTPQGKAFRPWEALVLENSPGANLVPGGLLSGGGRPRPGKRGLTCRAPSPLGPGLCVDPLSCIPALVTHGGQRHHPGGVLGAWQALGGLGRGRSQEHPSSATPPRPRGPRRPPARILPPGFGHDS